MRASAGFCLASCLLVALQAACGQPLGSSGPEDVGLFPVLVDGRWGLIDEDGELVVEPRFDRVGPFIGGVALVVEEERYGLLAQDGRTILEPLFQRLAFPFFEGLTYAQSVQKVGFVDQSGQFRIELPVAVDATSSKFSEGLARVKLGEKWGYIDAEGEMVIAPTFDFAREFSSGRAAVRQGDRWGYLDARGKLAITPQFDSAWDFEDDRAVVELGGQRGLIDSEGVYIVRPQYSTVRSMGEGLLAVVDSQGAWALMSSHGEVVVPPRFESLGSFLPPYNACFFCSIFDRESMMSGFINGSALAMQDEKWGLINTRGEYRVMPRYDDLWPMREGRALFRRGDLMGFVDDRGEEVIEAQFESFDSHQIDAEEPSFSNGLAPVLMGGRWGFVDLSGNLAINPQFDLVLHGFHGELAAVVLGGDYGYIDQQGHFVFGPERLVATAEPEIERTLDEHYPGWSYPALSLSDVRTRLDDPEQQPYVVVADFDGDGDDDYAVRCWWMDQQLSVAFLRNSDGFDAVEFDGLSTLSVIRAGSDINGRVFDKDILSTSMRYNQPEILEFRGDRFVTITIHRVIDGPH